MSVDSSQHSNKENRKIPIDNRIEEARLVRRIVFILSIIIILLIGGGITGGYYYLKSALQPVAPEDKTTVNIEIPIGSSVGNIARILEENGIIRDATVFRYYIKFKNESGFQAGDYEFSPSMEIKDIIAYLKTGKVIKEAAFTVTIPEGTQIDQIATIVEEHTEHSKDDFLAKVNDLAYLESLIEKYPAILTERILDPELNQPLEGYLYPSTYDFYEEQPTLEQIIEKMLSQTEFVLSTYQDKIEAKGYSIHEFLTLSSLIEEEATQKADREKIASVFYNRMDKGMPLQTDPTVLYALGKHQVGITLNDLKVDSPYNTYVIKGLPIGPIANAGEVSIRAALNPAKSDALYFYARPNGEVLFSKTLREHNNIKNKYKDEWEKYKENE